MPSNNPLSDLDESKIDSMDVNDVRKLLRGAAKSNKELAKEVAKRDAALAVHDAGLGHLNEAQRGALVYQLGDRDVTADNLKASAAALGFSTEAPTTTPTNGDQGNPPANPPSNQPPGQPPAAPGQPQFLDEMPGSNAPDPRAAINTSIQGLTRAEYADIQARRGGTGTGNLHEAMTTGHKSKKELLAIISNQGPSEGIVLDSDFD